MPGMSWLTVREGHAESQNGQARQMVRVVIGFWLLGLLNNSGNTAARSRRVGLGQALSIGPYPLVPSCSVRDHDRWGDGDILWCCGACIFLRHRTYLTDQAHRPLLVRALSLHPSVARLQPIQLFSPHTAGFIWSDILRECVLRQLACWHPSHWWRSAAT
jgi:hypothetical protein